MFLFRAFLEDVYQCSSTGDTGKKTALSSKALAKIMTTYQTFYCP